MVQFVGPLIVAPLAIDELSAPADVAEDTELLAIDCADLEPNEFEAVTVTAKVARGSAGASSA